MFCAQLHIVGQGHGAGRGVRRVRRAPVGTPDQPGAPSFVCKGNNRCPCSVGCLECSSRLAGTHYSRLALAGVRIMLHCFTFSFPCFKIKLEHLDCANYYNSNQRIHIITRIRWFECVIFFIYFQLAIRKHFE